MNNLSKTGLIELSPHEMTRTKGGLLLVGIDLIMWSYTELKRGIHDGYYNK